MEAIQNMEQLLEKLVNEQRESSGLIGLGAIIVQDGKVIGPMVSGKRRKGKEASLTSEDLWHIGSVTKSFTATMIARLVEKGKLNWNTTIKEFFSKTDGLNLSWYNVTLEHLLTHTSGAVANFPFLVNFKNPAEGVERMEARESAVINILKKEPETELGSTFTYSNVGYTIAGVIAEKVTGTPWEELINEEVFIPLQIQNGGFGPPLNTDKELSQPRGHRSLFGFTIAVDTQDDNSPIIGPAGTIHLSLSDLSLFANEHLKGVQGKSTLLKPETFQRLHKPSLDDYAYGWIVETPQDLAVGPVIWHNGSNTMWYTLLAIIPNINTVVAFTSNQGSFDVAEQSAWKIIKEVVQDKHNKNLKRDC
jgi:CubicO group peptidase (beta-lactamase class C family)